jgi:excisionase family DNA binding protein
MTVVAEPEFLTADEAAALLRVTRDTLLDRQGVADSGVPQGWKIGRVWRFRRTDFDNLGR